MEKQIKKPYLQVKFEMNGFKQGDMVVSNQATNKTPYKIDLFYCKEGVTEVHLVNSKQHWPIEALEHYPKTRRE
jgi:NifB/MoaA-like Fe-S oxidoreductase